MSEVTVKLVYGGGGPPDGEVAVVRLLGRLPGGWRYEQRHIGPVDIELRITAPHSDQGSISRAVTRALQDPALVDWRLTEAG